MPEPRWGTIEEEPDGRAFFTLPDGRDVPIHKGDMFLFDEDMKPIDYMPAAKGEA